MSTILKGYREDQILGKLNHIRENYLTWAKAVVTVFYLVGIIGMSIPSIRPYFQFLTPFHLLLNAGIMLLFHKSWNLFFVLFIILAFTIGYGSEVLGVKTGFPFGNYEYGPVLGVKLFDVPLMIGVNWLILVYLTGTVLHKRIRNSWLTVVVGALLMVLIDTAIEPVAIALDFWSWDQNIIPLSNYIGWFGVALLIQLIFKNFQFEKENKISGYLLANLIAFFVILNFIL